jgi:hypothetical protein
MEFQFAVIVGAADIYPRTRTWNNGRPIPLVGGRYSSSRATPKAINQTDHKI